MGKKRGRIKAFQGFLGALPVKIAAERANDAIVAEKRRLEERQAADVVEVKVAEQDVDGVRRVVAQMRSQRGKAGARIDDEEPVAAADFDARGVAAELGELRTGGAGRASDPPETYLELTRG